MTGMDEARVTARISSSPPRGMMTSTYASCCSNRRTASRSVERTSCTAASGKPTSAKARANTSTMAPLVSNASEPPLSNTALPALTHRPAASAVTLGRDS